MLPGIFDLMTGSICLVAGIMMVYQSPGYRCQVEVDEIQRNKSRPSFRILIRAAIGILIVGVLLVITWAFNLFQLQVLPVLVNEVG